jgi:hypothetical protein
MLRLELGASNALARALVVIHGAGAACLGWWIPGYAGPAMALLVLGLGAVSIFDRALLRNRASPSTLELSADGAVTLGLKDGRRQVCRAGARRYVGNRWVILDLSGSRRRLLLVARDMLSPADFRRLKLWALWGRVPGAAHPALAG